MKSLASYPDLQQVWDKYQSTRLRGVKKEAGKLLQSFINAIQLKEEKVTEEFVREICSTLLSVSKSPSRHSSEEHESSLKIQFPLFEQLILGELKKFYLTNDAEGIRWIAQLNQFFISRTSLTSEFLQSINVEFSVPLIDQQFFLRKSLELEHSPITLELIIDDLARKLNFATHHLSEGFLLPSDHFNKLYQELTHYVGQSEIEHDWREYLNYIQEINTAWKSYEKEKEGEMSFQEYCLHNGFLEDILQ